MVERPFNDIYWPDGTLGKEDHPLQMQRGGNWHGLAIDPPQQPVEDVPSCTGNQGRLRKSWMEDVKRWTRLIDMPEMLTVVEDRRGGGDCLQQRLSCPPKTFQIKGLH